MMLSHDIFNLEYPNAYSFVDTVAEYIEMVQHTAANGDVCNSNSSASTGGFGTLGMVVLFLIYAIVICRNICIVI